MTNSTSARGLRGSGNAGLTTKRRQRGTSLVEILVVIVIFLIGILAVVQVFPRGFQLLLTTRNNSVATALGREAVERLKGSPELIPDEVVPVVYVNGSPVVDPTVNPLSLAPQGDSLDASGVLTRGGSPVAGDWKLASGPNVARRILGEGHRIPAVREVYRVSDSDAIQNDGGLLVLDHNPIDPGPDPANPNIVAYGNEMSRTEGAPLETTVHNTGSVPADANGVAVQAILPNNTTAALTGALTLTTPVSTAPFEFFTVNATTHGDLPNPPGVLLPALATTNRTYRIRLSAYVNNGSGGARRVDYPSLSVFVPRTAATATTPPTVPPQLVYVPIAEVLKADGLIANVGDLYSVESESVRVAPQFRRVSTWTTAGSQNLDSTLYPNRTAPIDPFEMRVLDPHLGVLLFSPATRNGVVSRPGGVSEPLLARVDYDVLDWRVISEDFRTTKNDATVLLSLQSLKVGGNLGPDGLTNAGIFNGAFQGQNGNAGPWDPSFVPNRAPGSPRDNVIVIDLATGCEVQKYFTDNTDALLNQTAADDPTGTDSTKVLVGVDKSRGSITFHPVPGAGQTPSVRLLVPKAGAAPIVVPAANRTFRVVYRARQEWAVQTLKGASQYTLVNSLPNGADFLPDMAFLGDGSGGTATNRIYFAASQAGSKVTIDRIAYVDANNKEQVLEGQDFVLQGGNGSYAFANVGDAVPIQAFSTRYGSTPVQGIKGASVSVRVLWNPESLALTNDTTTNFARIDQYNRGWRKSTSQTYLRAEETR